LLVFVQKAYKDYQPKIIMAKQTILWLPKGKVVENPAKLKKAKQILVKKLKVTKTI